MRALPLWLALAVAFAAPGVSWAGEGDGPTVRVLLTETRGPVRVEGPGLDAWIDAAGDGAVRQRGASPSARWHSRGGGPFRVAGFRVRGALEVMPAAAGLAVVNELPLDTYVAATLGAETYASWQAAALEAQAVAIRTYALHQRAARRAAGALWDLVAGTRSQVYRGVDAESDAVWAAVRATRGEVVTFRGAPILAVYHSASGGRTAGAEEVWGRPLPYLRSHPVDGEEDSPDTYWRTTIERTTLRRALAARGDDPGPIRAVEVTERWPSGRVRALRVRGSRGEVTVGGRELREALGERTLKSTLFEVRTPGDGAIVFVGSGSGHGVGMSQWGARALAARGLDHRAILARFYPETRLERWRWLTERERGVREARNGKETKR